MKGIFVNENGGIPYAQAIVRGVKPIETRNKNMLSALVGERVAIIRTHRNKAPLVLGYATILWAEHCSKEYMDAIRSITLIPEGSEHDAGKSGKWCYYMADPVACDPFPLPFSAIRHGRSWCEFDND